VSAPGESDVTTCYRHNTNRAGVVCQRCDRPICTQCMHQASVGFHCPECVAGGKQRVIQGPPVFDPLATKVLIGINVLAFVWGIARSGSLTRIGGPALIDGGLFALAFDGEELIGVAEGEWYRLVSSGFLHDGMLHLGFNMYALWILGSQLERVLDRPRFLALYVTSMLGGAAGVMLLDPDVPTVGASGAVFGLFGAMAVVQRAAGLSIWASGIGQILALNLILTFAIPSISVGGHVGGLVAGLVVGALYVALVRAHRSEWLAFGITVVLGVGLAAAAIALANNPVL
jgi:membrane associated rhomboid family serine protease